jgi:hypothetical protein
VFSILDPTQQNAWYHPFCYFTLLRFIVLFWINKTIDDKTFSTVHTGTLYVLFHHAIPKKILMSQNKKADIKRCLTILWREISQPCHLKGFAS